MLLQFTLLILFGQAVAKAGDPAQEAYFRANQLFIQGRLEQSLEAVNDALRLNPNFVPALTLRAKLSMAFNRLAEAGRDLTRAVELEPKSAYNQFMLGFYYYLENDFKRALEPLNRSAELDEANSRTYFYLALTHEGLANASMAIQLYEKAIALDREKKTPDLDTLIAFARLLFSLGQYEKCLSLVEQALSLDSKSRDAHYERGRLYLQAGDFKTCHSGRRAGASCYRVPEPLTGKFTFCWRGHMGELAINHEPTNIWPNSRLRRHHCGVEPTMERRPPQSRATFADILMPLTVLVLFHQQSSSVACLQPAVCGAVPVTRFRWRNAHSTRSDCLTEPASRNVQSAATPLASSHD